MWGQLRCARTATTTITPTLAHPTATMDQVGSRAESLLAPGPGSMAIMPVRASTRDVATTDASRPYPHARHFGVESIVVTLAATLTVEACMVTRMRRWRRGGFQVVGTGRLHHQFELSRPTAFAVGRLEFMYPLRGASRCERAIRKLKIGSLQPRLSYGQEIAGRICKISSYRQESGSFSY